MRKRLLGLGLSHAIAGLEMRERAAVPAARLGQALDLLSAQADVEGAFVLSTCGRTEVYVSGTQPERMRTAVAGVLADLHGPAYEDYREALEARLDGAAARHLFRVACGLESQLAGESQVLGQVRNALRAARSAGTLDTMVAGTADRAIAAARRARAQSGIGRGVASVGHAAVAAMTEVAGAVRGRSVLVVGAGEVGELAVRALRTAGASVLVASRGGKTAVALGRRHGATAINAEQVLGRLAKVDAVVFTAAVTRPLAGRDDLRAALAGRTTELLVLDLGVPRNVDRRAAGLPGLVLLNIDDLAARVNSTLERRRAATATAEMVLEMELEAWEAWARAAGRAPTLAALAAYAEGIRLEEIRRAARGLGEDPVVLRRLDAMSKALVSKLLVHPVAYLKAHPEDGEAADLLLRMFTEPPGK